MIQSHFSALLNDPSHRKAPPTKRAEMFPAKPAVLILQRPLAFYGAVGERLASLNAKGAA